MTDRCIQCFRYFEHMGASFLLEKKTCCGVNYYYFVFPQNKESCLFLILQKYGPGSWSKSVSYLLLQRPLMERYFESWRQMVGCVAGGHMDISAISATSSHDSNSSVMTWWKLKQDKWKWIIVKYRESVKSERTNTIILLNEDFSTRLFQIIKYCGKLLKTRSGLLWLNVGQLSL